MLQNAVADCSLMAWITFPAFEDFLNGKNAFKQSKLKTVLTP
jgi:hypothetical protein